MLFLKRGDVFKSKCEIIIHGCNCFNTMGKGIAAVVKKEFPLAFDSDQRTTKGDRSKLGKYTSATDTSAKYGTKTIVNAYTQFTFWDKNDMFCQKSFDLVISDIIKDFKQPMAMPAIGLGLANGKLPKIMDTLLIESQKQDIHLHVTDKLLYSKIEKYIV